jgi:dihydroxyacid dehydratase/phosphogluconate dehydratase
MEQTVALNLCLDRVLTDRAIENAMVVHAAFGGSVSSESHAGLQASSESSPELAQLLVDGERERSLE